MVFNKYDIQFFKQKKRLHRVVGFKKTGGGRGIRTPARCYPPVGFQDRSLQPDLGIPPYYIALMSYRQELIYHDFILTSTSF